MIDKLQTFGLTEREAQVYYAALELGKATADQLAKHAGIVRSTSYTQIESLMRQGLMTTYDEGKKTFYVAESPSNLERTLDKKRESVDEQERELQKVLPELSSLFNSSGERPKVRMFKDKNGIIALRSEILKMKEKQYRVLFSYDDFVKVFDTETERNDFTKKRQKKGIKAKVIFVSNEPTAIGDPSSLPDDFRWISAAKLNLKFDIYIFDNKVAFASMKGEVWAALIEGESISSSMTNLFELIWGGLDQTNK